MRGALSLRVASGESGDVDGVEQGHHQVPGGLDGQGGDVGDVSVGRGERVKRAPVSLSLRTATRRGVSDQSSLSAVRRLLPLAPGRASWDRADVATRRALRPTLRKCPVRYPPKNQGDTNGGNAHQPK